MIAPGLRPGASAIHFAIWSGVLGNRPPAMVVRLATWLGVGPMMPADTPSLAWPPMHAAEAKMRPPCPPGVGEASPSGVSFWAAHQTPRSAGGLTNAFIR